MSFTLCVGEALIDFISQSKLSDVGGSEFFRRAPGGAVANVAVGIARLGGHAHFAGTLSRDSFGRFLLRTLAHENVNVDGVRVVDAATTLAFVALGESGERDFVFVRNPGADSLLSSSDVETGDLAHARILHFGGVLLASEPARSACLNVAASARRAGALVSFDPNARPALFQSRDEMKRWLLAGCAAADLVKLSEGDLQEMSMTLADAPALINEVTHAVIATRGALGARWINAANELGDVRAPHIDAVDTTGAGDAATAAILWRLAHVEGASFSSSVLADATRYGCAAGAVACLREGAMPSLPTPSDLEAMLPRLPKPN
jgi:fructokinase